MKRILVLLSSLVLLLSIAGTASAAVYEFEDMIDTWGCLDAAYIGQNHPLKYTHDINDEVDFNAGDYVTDAWLELDFTNDLTDSNGSKLFGRVKWDYRENAKVAYDGHSWVNLGEVDNGQYEIVLDIDWLNSDGILDVTIGVSNPLGTATAWLDHSRLYGHASTAPVPEPATILLLGTGLVGLVGAYRKKAKRILSANK